MSWLAKLLRTRFDPGPGEAYGPMPENTGASQPAQDTLAAIDALSQAVKNNPEAVEIYLALGNLYRAQGEIERAVQIRNSLIVRLGLEKEFKARAWFELGRDFRRGGFMDRAWSAFDEAKKLMGERPSILLEMARLAADSGENATAAKLYERLGRPLPQAHYMVKTARECFASGQDAQGHKLLRKAMGKVYRPSIEAWLESLIQIYGQGSRDKFTATFAGALDAVRPELRFVLLEGLLQFFCGSLRPEAPGTPYRDKAMIQAMLPILDQRPPDVLMSYYGAWMMLVCEERSLAVHRLEKALMLRPDFWLARLEMLSLTRDEQEISGLFKEQLDYFVDKARMVKRFLCSCCGLKRDSIFFVCPRCNSWHSIAFRMEIAG